MNPNKAQTLVRRALSPSSLVFLSGVVGSALAAGPARAQAEELAHVPPEVLPPWLAPFAPLLPLLVGALGGSASVAAAWIARTIFGVSLAAVAAGLDGGAAVLEARAKRSATPDDDVPASALAAAMREAASRLRDAEAEMPFQRKGGK